MANPIKEALKVNRKTFINPRGWVDYDTVKDETKTVVGLFKTAFTKERAPTHKETFEEALQRLHISPEELENTSNNYLAFAAFFLLAGLMLVGFGIYLILDGFFLGLLLSIAMSAVLFAQAFRFHFWYFQIKHRKLGCTFEEWRRGRLNDEV